MAAPLSSRRKRQSGFGLLEAIMAIGILGLVAAGFATLMRNSLASQKGVTDSVEFTDIKRMIESRVDCQKTAKIWATAGISAATCTDLVPLYDGAGKLVVDVANPGSKFGGWTARALCVGPTNAPGQKEEWGLEMQIAKPTAAATDPLHDTDPKHFVADPMRKAYALSWFNNTRPKKGYAAASSLYLIKSRSLCQSQLFGTLISGGANVPQNISCIIATNDASWPPNPPFTGYGPTTGPSNVGGINPITGGRPGIYNCPASNPVAMSAQLAGGCSGISGTQMAYVQFGAYDYPSQFVCGQQYWMDYYDASDPTKEPYAGYKKSCDNAYAKNGYPPGMTNQQLYGWATCAGVCCSFPKN